MKKYPLNEELVWNRGEDIDWSKKYRQDNEFKMNPYSIVKLPFNSVHKTGAAEYARLEVYEILQGALRWKNCAAGLERF